MRAKITVLAMLAVITTPLAWAASLATYTVGADISKNRYLAEGQIEAVRQSMIAPQVPGQILSLAVRAGDSVHKGQLLARLDDSAAAQNAAASRAMIGAANAQLTLAQRDFLRQQQLYADGYISQSALDRARAQYQAARAGAAAQTSQAGAASASARFYSLSAPYAGLVSSVSAVVGDMAMPGQKLMVVYDPSALKAVATLPQSMLAALKVDTTATVLVGTHSLAPQRVTVAPGADPASHTVEVRLDLAQVPKDIVPGTFARVAFLLGNKAQTSALRIPSQAIVRRSELTGVYVMSRSGRPLLRQIRLGESWGGWVEVQAGLSSGEVIALDPLAAARATAGE